MNQLEGAGVVGAGAAGTVGTAGAVGTHHGIDDRGRELGIVTDHTDIEILEVAVVPNRTKKDDKQRRKREIQEHRLLIEQTHLDIGDQHGEE